MLKTLFITLFYSVVFSYTVCAQRIIPENSYDIHRRLEQLNNLTSVLYIAAHPDDENTRLLAYLAHERQYNTYYVSLTRGEGGQNLIGTELGQGLGLIRNYELLAARDIDGAHQLFSSTIDFGFSKNPDETFKFWDKERIIGELMDIIRHIRPDVLICRFPTTGEGGHGHHTASAIIALETYNRLLQDDEAFHPQRLLFNAFRFGDRNTIKDDHFPLSTQQYNAGLGLSYGQLAGTSRSIHRSQGVGTPQSIGIQNEYFELMAGEPIKNDIIDRDITWNRVNAPQITVAVNSILQHFDFNNPAAAIPDLIRLKKQILSDVKDTYWKDIKVREIDALILSCSGIQMEALSSIPEATTGQQISVRLNAIARADAIVLKSVTWQGKVLSKDKPLQDDILSSEAYDLYLPDSLPMTQPYWLDAPRDGWHYSYNRSQAFHPDMNTYAHLEIELEIDGEVFRKELPLAFKYTHPLRGDVTEYFRITPAMVINPTQDIIFFRGEKEQNTFSFYVKTYKTLGPITLSITDSDNNRLIETLTLQAPTPLKDSLYSFAFSDKYKGVSHIKLELADNKKTYASSQQYIKYDHLPELVIYKPAHIQIVQPEWTVPDQKIAYIHGAGDKVADALKNLGLDIEVLPGSVLSHLSTLKGYSTVIMGIRAYNTLPNINTQMDVLMEYVRQGGRVIVQYNTSNNLLTGNFGPYPFSISRNRVTEEDADVIITAPDDPLLNTPHKIHLSDFDNWVQERGLYFPDNLSPEYKTVMTMHDTGEAPLNTALMYARYGKGTFIYTGISFFRQIPAGQKGAIKLFLNCIEL